MPNRRLTSAGQSSSTGGAAYASAMAEVMSIPTTIDAVPEYSYAAKASAVAKVDIVTYAEPTVYVEAYGELLPSPCCRVVPVAHLDIQESCLGNTWTQQQLS
jgi:hypothetical protein